ncbi:hypothetical protein PspLS_08443 [Pyricularia sp. CBS 133598]|nr:hypothetical protein PspLS_08443 [Pyricularia sp. CBS 133598]
MQHLREYGLQDDHQLSVHFKASYYLAGGVSHHDAWPNSFDTFIGFPERHGWKVDPITNVLTPPKHHTANRPDPDCFLQAWLWFGLGKTILQKENGPIEWYDVKSKTAYVDTSRLPSALEQWVRCEDTNKGSNLRRMIKAEHVLDLAKKIMRANCVVESPDKLGFSKEVLLSIMVMGETLAAVKDNIMNSTDSKIKGWHGEDDSGWGPSQHVFDLMKDNKWCPHQINLLRGQFRSSVTLLLMACYDPGHREREKQREQHGITHKKCTKEACSADKNIMTAGGDHHLIKYDKKAVRGLLSKGNVPLFRFQTNDDDDVRLEVVNRKEDMEYVTFSHVWADGWGSEKNKLCRCKLKFIRKRLNAIMGQHDIPFWIDTLAVQTKDKKARTKAIGQIYDVFLSSSCTIVLDMGLMSINPRGDTSQVSTAMSILSSSWMRRLWTLQEAFLSQKLVVPFKALSDFQDLSDLIKNLENEQKKGCLSKPMIGLIHKHLSFGIMGNHCRALTPGLVNSKASKQTLEMTRTLLGDIWRAVNWRTTSRATHEALALSTLLGLQVDEDQIVPERQLPHFSGKGHEDKQDQMMERFWRSVEERKKGSIPPGFIFLPGSRIKRRGFGWAPRTWMSAQATEFPDPLNSFVAPADLDKVDHGLKVTYPGFLLHSNARARILGVGSVNDPEAGSFRFPVDQNMREWYGASTIKDDGVHNPKLLETVLPQTHLQLAIVLSRPRPGEKPSEIGLLVQIYGSEMINEETNGSVSEKRAYHCEILHRLQVSRHAGDDRKAASIITDSDICIGETLEPDQVWYIDGYQDIDGRHREDLGGTRRSFDPQLSPALNTPTIHKVITPRRSFMGLKKQEITRSVVRGNVESKV